MNDREPESVGQEMARAATALSQLSRRSRSGTPVAKECDDT